MTALKFYLGGRLVMKKVFVVGGSGRVATDLIKDLVATGNEVTAGARHPKKLLS
jgi:uncharacterized protein YbjT (DUF2867 family)